MRVSSFPYLSNIRILILSYSSLLILGPVSALLIEKQPPISDQDVNVEQPQVCETQSNDTIVVTTESVASNKSCDAISTAVADPNENQSVLIGAAGKEVTKVAPVKDCDELPVTTDTPDETQSVPTEPLPHVHTETIAPVKDCGELSVKTDEPDETQSVLTEPIGDTTKARGTDEVRSVLTEPIGDTSKSHDEIQTVSAEEVSDSTKTGHEGI